MANNKDKVTFAAALRNLKNSSFEANFTTLITDGKRNKFTRFKLQKLLKCSDVVDRFVLSNGMNILHCLVFKNRDDLIIEVYHAGMWDSMYSAVIKTPDSLRNTPEYAYKGLTARELAMQLKKSLIVVLLDKLNTQEGQLTDLHKSARKGESDKLKVLASSNSEQMKEICAGTSVLSWACIAGSTEISRFVLDFNSSEPEAREAESCVKNMVLYGHTDLLLMTLEHLKLNTNHKMNNGKSLLKYAAYCGQYEVFQKLLQNGATLDDSIIIETSSAGNLEFLQGLVQEYPGMSINTKDANNRTAIFYAVHYQHRDVVEFLLNNGADLDITDKQTRNVFHIAAFRGQFDILADLLVHIQSQSVSGNLLSKLMNTPCLYIEKDHIFNIRGRDGQRQAWHILLVHRHLLGSFYKHTKGGAIDVACFGQVLKSGFGPEPPADVQNTTTNRQDLSSGLSRDQTPLNLAICSRNFKVAMKLVEAGADVNIPDCFSLSPLHMASVVGSVDLVTTLLDKGASARAQDRNGHTPEQLAEMNGFPEVASTIRRHAYQALIERFFQQGVDTARTELRSCLESENEQQIRRRLVSALRELSSEVNSLLFDIGSGPIQEETTPSSSQPYRR